MSVFDGCLLQIALVASLLHDFERVVGLELLDGLHQMACDAKQKVQNELDAAIEQLQQQDSKTAWVETVACASCSGVVVQAPTLLAKLACFAHAVAGLTDVSNHCMDATTLGAFPSAAMDDASSATAAQHNTCSQCQSMCIVPAVWLSECHVPSYQLLRERLSRVVFLQADITEPLKTSPIADWNTAGKRQPRCFARL